MNLIRNLRRKGAAFGLLISLAPALISGTLTSLFPNLLIHFSIIDIVGAYYFVSKEDEFLVSLYHRLRTAANYRGILGSQDLDIKDVQKRGRYKFFNRRKRKSPARFRAELPANQPIIGFKLF